MLFNVKPIPKTFFMKHIATSVVFFLTLGINKSLAQGHFASVSRAEAATPNNSVNISRDVHTAAAPPATATVKETPVATYHPFSPASVPSAANHSYAPASGDKAVSTTSINAYNEPPATLSGTVRYSPVGKQPYVYYSTPVTRYKSKRHNHSYIKRNNCGSAPFICLPEFLIFFDIGTILDEVLMDNENIPARGGGSVLNTSLDGYVVNGADTLSGIVTMTEKAIYLEQPIDDKRETGYMFLYDDNNVKTVAVFEGSSSLYLGRPGGTGKLSRVIHDGKLAVYDDNQYRFLTLGNVHKTKLLAVYNGQVKSPKSFVAADGKQLLIESINAAYGQQLDAKDFTWSQLLSYLDKLD